MSINKNKFQPTYKGSYGFWRLLKIITIGVLAFGAMFTYYFIYQNIYSTIANANAIISLKSRMGAYELDLQSYEKAKAAIIQKKHLEDIPTNLRNIFYYVTINTSTYVNTTTKR